MIRIIVVTWVVVSGQATYYNPGVFEEVAANRHLPPCHECTGYISLLDCEDLGKLVWVSNGKETVGPLQNIDCASPKHRQALIQSNWAADLPHWLAVRWGMAGPISITVMTRRREMYYEFPQ